MVELVKAGDEETIEELKYYRHVVIDEAQDLVDKRHDLIRLLLENISPEAGFTVLGDPYQAIYDYSDSSRSNTDPEERAS